MMHYFIMIILSGMVVISSSASASELETERSLLGSGRTETSRDWLELQGNGEQSSMQEQWLAPAVQDRIYQRYLDSFLYPIPENFYSRDRFREGP